jgi:trk system potassium uptake protein TrkH
MAFTLPRFTTAQTITVSFIGLILVGALLLSLPWASAPGKSTSFVDALFTSTSAVCVTGLIVRDTPGDFSLFGQIVILLLIQAGGLGYMVLTTVVIFALGGKLSLQERSTLRESLNLQSGERLVRFTMNVFKLTLAFELTGAVILTLAFWADHGSRAPWLGLFHAVSAFNNAGFSLFPDNLIRYRSDLVVNLVITALIICGGLGFLVLSELLKVRRTLPLSLQARLVLVVSAVLCVGGMAAILALEWDNPFSLSPMPLDEKLLVAWFHSVTARTAGFNTIDMSTLQPTTLFIVMALMFIGASPGGTGGGALGHHPRRRRHGDLPAAAVRHAGGAGLLHLPDFVSGAEHGGAAADDPRAVRDSEDSVRVGVGIRHGGAVHRSSGQRAQPGGSHDRRRQAVAGAADDCRPRRSDDPGGGACTAAVTRQDSLS